ncbi:MAG: aldehyde dehydrogenase [Pseudobacteriovorax sp.]|nr:aldehyde dehydrogenase [Pseudobacteriovorax sp.]
MLNPETQIVSTAGQSIDIVREIQHKRFANDSLRPHAARLAILKKFKETVKRYESELIQALKEDLGRSAFESYAADVGLVIDEISYAEKNLRKWMKPRRVPTPLALMPAKSFEVMSPLGQTLIIGPWNYPIQLLLIPLVGALAAGNTVVVKPSELAAACESVLSKILNEAFDDDVVSTFTGGVDVSTLLLSKPWDHIFFTGSTPVGRIVAKAAAATLSPVTLELGGKSPVFVTPDADLQLTARRLVYGKFFNTGQTCVSPDYALVHESHRAKFVDLVKKVVEDFYGQNPKESEDFGRIINQRNLTRLLDLIDADKVALGGDHSAEDRYLAPTILDDVSWDDKVMEEEIFGPILPIIYYKNLPDAIKAVKKRDHPLACYIFSENRGEQSYLLNTLSFGGGCVNDTLVHVSSHHLPFGGVGPSGQGNYHGKNSFDTFSHRKGMMRNPSWLDLPVRYPPYASWKFKLIKLLIGR